MTTLGQPAGGVGAPKRSRNPLYFFWLSTLLAWLCWLLIVVLMWTQWRLGVVHFLFLPFAALFLTMLGALVGTEVLAVRHWRRGQMRVRIVAWAFIGFLPLVLFIVPCGYGAYMASRSIKPGNVFFKFAVGVATTAMEGHVKLAYRHRMEMDRLVMFYNQLEAPLRDAQVMDGYLASLEQGLGRKLPAKIYWVRGPLLGRRYGSLPGFALGTDWSPDWDTFPGDDSDRHELAHAALFQLRLPDADPPIFFDEGWADSQELSDFNLSDQHFASLLSKLSRQRHLESVPLLRELVRPEWYHNHVRRKYVHHSVGAPLVVLLLREFGSAPFLELYNTCQPKTFDADCRRILGVGLDDLQRMLDQELKKHRATSQ